MSTSLADRSPLLTSPAQAQSLRLSTACQVLFTHPHRIKALKLVHQFFPEESVHILTERDWLEIMSHFFRLLRQKDWFEIDWDPLEDLFKQLAVKQMELIKNDLDSPVPELNWLAVILDYIPVRCYGFTNTGWNSNIQAHLPFELLKFLLGPEMFRPSPRLKAIVEGVEGWTSWPERDRLILQQHLRAIPPNMLPAGFQHLPEAVRYACSKTGNFLLDHASSWHDWRIGWYRWDKPGDLDFLRQQWQAAKPVLSRVRQFEQAYQGRQQLITLVLFLQTFWQEVKDVFSS